MNGSSRRNYRCPVHSERPPNNRASGSSASGRSLTTTLGAPTMIPLTHDQYAAIGRVAVESGTLEREVAEYIIRLGQKPKGYLGTKVAMLRQMTQSHSPHFDAAIKLVEALLERRNTVVHGVWSPVSNAPITMGEITATRGQLTLHAREIDQVASKLRATRKLLLAICHDYCPQAAGTRRRPAGTIASLFQKASS